MQYEEFLEEILQMVQERFGDGYRFTPMDIPANNGVIRHSLAISHGASGVSPCIRMDGFFREHLSGCGMGRIAEEIQASYENSAGERFDLPAFLSWERIRPKICCRLVNTGKNEAMLPDFPHREVLDLSIVYYVQVSMSGGAVGTVRVRNEHMGYWGIGEAALYEAAMSNREGSRETTIKSLDETLGEIFGQDWVKNCRDPHAPKMYVLGRRDFAHGAVGMLDKKALKKAAGIFGREFAILPSSVHEVLLVPVTGAEGEMEGYAKIVREVNDTQVLPEEVLSYHVYRYSEDTEELTIAA